MELSEIIIISISIYTLLPLTYVDEIGADAYRNALSKCLKDNVGGEIYFSFMYIYT